MIIIGSKAIKHHFPDFNREPKDLDFAIKTPSHVTSEVADGQRIEYLYNPVIFKYSKVGHLGYLEPELLLTLKLSHIFWDLAWEKTLYDIQFLFGKGLKYNKEAFYELYEYWNEFHGKNKRSDLKMTKEDFFNNALKTYDHDHLHTLINPNPTYEKMLADGAEVEISEEKWEASSFEDKLNLIREEVYVMGFERFENLDVPKAYLHRHAYTRMFKKYIISHAPLYVALFAMENYKHLFKPTINFIEVIREKL